MILPLVTLIAAVKAWAWRPQQAINIRQSEESRKSPAKTTKTKFHCCNWVRCDTKALKHHCDHKWHCRRQCKGSVWGLQQVGPPRSKQRKKGELGRLLIVLHMIPWSVYQKCEKRLGMTRLWKCSVSAFFEPLHALVVWKVLFRIITGPFLMQRLCVWIVQNTKKCLFNFLFTSRYAQNDVFCKWKVLCSKIYHTYFYSNFLQLPKTIIGPPTMVLVWSICSQTKGSY